MYRLLILLSALLLGSCTYATRQIDHYPALPQETEGAAYTPVAEVSESIHYYVDTDVFPGIFSNHRAVYLIDHDVKIPLYVRFDGWTDYYPEFYDMGGQERTVVRGITNNEDYELNEINALLLNRYLNSHPDVDVILNPGYQDSCAGDWYYALAWIMVDRECTLTLTGTAARLR